MGADRLSLDRKAATSPRDDGPSREASTVAIGTPGPRRDLAILLIAAALLFTANIGRVTLPPLDDCFYAEKAREMTRHWGMTVTWNEAPTFQTPPMPIWTMAASQQFFGSNDAASRLPTVIEALGVLAGIAWLGAELASPAAGVTAAALLCTAPFFLNNARRCMLEIPLLFWVVGAMVSLVAWRRRPAWILAFGPFLGAAILTKSVLGLLPLGLALTAAVLLRTWRPLLRDLRFWLAIVLGLAIGASWYLEQWKTWGPQVIVVHFQSEIAHRSMAKIGLWTRVLGNPAILLAQFEPVALLAVPGAYLLWRRWRAQRDDGAALLLIWMALPVALYSLSSARSPRYLFPVFAPLALAAAAWLVARFPRAAGTIARRVVPAALLIAAAIFWIRPGWLSSSSNEPFRESAAMIRERVPKGEVIRFIGGDYWRYANPLLWFADRQLDPWPDTLARMVQAARVSSGRVLFCEKGRLDSLPPEIRSAPRLMEVRGAVLLDLAGR